MQNQDLASLNLLDADELFALGLRASASGDGGPALAYLKLALSKAPGHAKAHWAIATEYAALGMPDRAAEHFARAVTLDPTQPVARFQYGLLHLSGGDAAQARALWAPLNELPADSPLRLFKDGLLHMASDEFDQALAMLEAGLAHPDVLEPLRRDMEMAVSRIRGVAQVAAQHGAPAAEAAPADDDVLMQSHLALSAYATGGGGGGRTS